MSYPCPPPPAMPAAPSGSGSSRQSTAELREGNPQLSSQQRCVSSCGAQSCALHGVISDVINDGSFLLSKIPSRSLLRQLCASGRSSAPRSSCIPHLQPPAVLCESLSAHREPEQLLLEELQH